MANGANGSTTRAPLVTTSGQQFLIALAVLTLVALLLGILSFVVVPTDNRTVLNVAAGYVFGFGSAVMAFYFPSSIGARSKDEAITKLTDLASANPSPSHAPSPDANANQGAS